MTETKHASLPFDVTECVPNAETQAVFDEVEDMIAGRIPKPRSQSVREMFEEYRESALFTEKDY